MALKASWAQALAWRLRRQLLDPIGAVGVTDVVRRLGGVQAQVASSADLAICLRRARPEPGDVARAIADGDLLKTWAMRGALHLVTPEEGGAFLSLMAAGRSWERPAWARYFGLTPQRMEHLRSTVRLALDGAVLTREELVGAIAEQPELTGLADELRSGWGTLLKPLAWQGDLCFGPSQGTRVTFMRPDDASPRWAGLPDPEVAAPIAIETYLRAYGPATPEAFGRWISGGYFGKRELRKPFDAMGDRLAEVDLDGSPALVMADDLDELAATRPTGAVRLLGGFDQYVLGPGTDDEHVIPAARRREVSRQSGWISPIVLSRGVVRGTWKLEGERVAISWFSEAGRPPRDALGAEVVRLGALLELDLVAEIDVG